jgi:CHASE2 domain-containing sensor protein
VPLGLNRSRPEVPVFDYWVEYAWGAVIFSTIGAVIASRRPENRIGWIFCAVGLVGGVHHFGAEYAIYASLAAPGMLPGAAALAWIASWTWVP